MTPTIPDLPVPFASIDALESADLTYTDETPEDAVRAVAAPVVAAELRRLAKVYRDDLGGIKHDLFGAVMRDLHRRADDLDPHA